MDERFSLSTQRLQSCLWFSFVRINKVLVQTTCICTNSVSSEVAGASK
jgi:hypothetical protein